MISAKDNCKSSTRPMSGTPKAAVPEEYDMAESKATTKITVHNRMMYDQRMISAGPAAGVVRILYDAAGYRHIFVKPPILNDMSLHCYSEDSTSPTGWRSQDTVLPGRLFRSMETANDAEGSPGVFVLTEDASGGGPDRATLYRLELDGHGRMRAPLKITSYDTPDPVMTYCAIGATLFSSRSGLSANELFGCIGKDFSQQYAVHDGEHAIGLSQYTRIAVVPGKDDEWPNISLAALTGSRVSVLRGVSMDSNLLVEKLLLPDFPGGPIPAAAKRLSAVCYDDGRRRIFAIGSDGLLRSIDARTVSGRGLLWDKQWTEMSPDMGAVFTPLVEIEAVARNKGVTLCAVDYKGRTWVMESEGADEPWSRPMELAGPQVAAGTCTANREGEATFTYVDTSGFTHVMTRDEDWNDETIDLGQGTVAVPSSVYRVGIEVTNPQDADAPVGGEPLSITADDDVLAFAKDTSTKFAKGVPTIIDTDSDGCIWLMVDITDSIGVPSFTIGSPSTRFEEMVTIRPEAGAQAHATSVDAQALRTALDDQGKPLLPVDAQFDVLADSLRRLGSSAEHAYAPLEYHSPSLTITPSSGVRVQDAAAKVRLTRPDLDRLGTWVLEKGPNGISIRDVSPSEAATIRLSLIEEVAMSRSHKGDPLAIFDFFDDWVDAFEWLAEGIVELGTMVFDGAKALISFTIDGIKRIVEKALDELSVVTDAISAVLNFAGAVVGRVVGWLVRAIGWLLDLPDLAKIKDTIRKRFTDGVNSLKDILPDPAISAAHGQTVLEDLKTTLHGYVEQYRSSPAGLQSNSSYFGGVKSVVSSMVVGSTSVAAETTWLIEKLASALPNIKTGIPSAPDYGMQATVSDIGTRFASMEGNLVTMMTDMAAAALQGYVDAMSNLDASNLDPILTVIDQHAGAMLDSASGILGDIGTITHAVWQDPQRIVEWLDTPIDIPFFAGFYEGLVGHKLTLLDFVSMAAAIPYSIVAPEDWKDEFESSDPLEGLFYTVFCLMLARTLAVGLSSAFQIPSGNEPGTPNIRRIIEITDLAVVVTDLLAGTMTLAYAKQDREKWMALGIADLGGSVAKAILLWSTLQPGADNGYGTAISDGFGVAVTVVSWILSGVTSGMSAEQMGYAGLSLTGDLLHLAVDRKAIPIGTPPARIAYGVLQGALNGTQAGLFWLDHHNAK